MGHDRKPRRSSARPLSSGKETFPDTPGTQRPVPDRFIAGQKMAVMGQFLPFCVTFSVSPLQAKDVGKHLARDW